MSPRTLGRSRLEGVRRVLDLGLQVEVLEDAVEQGQRALDLDLDVEQLAEREEQPDWSVVKATMSPIVGAFGSPLMMQRSRRASTRRPA